MGDDVKERWIELCEKAAVEQDPQKLLAFVKEISWLLESKDQQWRASTHQGPLREREGVSTEPTFPQNTKQQKQPRVT